MMEFAQAPDRLPPAEALFDELAFDLTHREARMPRGAPIDRASRAARVNIGTHVRRRVAGANARNERRQVIAGGFLWPCRLECLSWPDLPPLCFFGRWAFSRSAPLPPRFASVLTAVASAANPAAGDAGQAHGRAVTPA